MSLQVEAYMYGQVTNYTVEPQFSELIGGEEGCSYNRIVHKIEHLYTELYSTALIKHAHVDKIL